MAPNPQLLWLSLHGDSNVLSPDIWEEWGPHGFMSYDHPWPPAGLLPQVGNNFGWTLHSRASPWAQEEASLQPRSPCSSALQPALICTPLFHGQHSSVKSPENKSCDRQVMGPKMRTYSPSECVNTLGYMVKQKIWRWNWDCLSASLK